MKVEKDWYKIISGQTNEAQVKLNILNSFEAMIESKANEQGYSYKYTIINGHIYRRSLFK